MVVLVSKGEDGDNAIGQQHDDHQNRPNKKYPRLTLKSVRTLFDRVFRNRMIYKSDAAEQNENEKNN